MPSHNNNTFPVSHESWKLPPIPWLLVGVTFFLGLCFATFLNRGELGLILTHFSLLWGIENNRLIILGLFLRIVLTASVFAAIALACYLAFFVVKHYQQDDEVEGVVQRFSQSQSVQHNRVAYSSEDGNTLSARIPAPPEHLLPQQKPSTATVLPLSLQGVEELRASQAVQLPITPLPLSYPSETMMLSKSEIQEQQNTERGSGTLTADEEGRGSDKPFDDQDSQESAQEDALPVAYKEECEGETAPAYIEIRLLKDMYITLYVPRLGRRYPVKLDDLNPKARLLVAYMATQRGKLVKLDDMRTHVFGSDSADTDQVQNAFSTAKRDIRRRVHQTIETINYEAGEQVIPDDLDVFGLSAGKQYYLPAYCRVVDLSVIEQQQSLIDQAETSNQLINDVPKQVMEACDAIFKAYPGDFLEDLLVKYPDAVSPWPQSWAREPFTRYKEFYLQALLYAGEFERKAGDRETDTSNKRDHYTNAARLFAHGAMAACNALVFDGRFDTMVYFAKTGRREGHHVTLSEQFIRRAVAYYGKTGATTQANKAYRGYEKQMLHISGRTWTAHPETLKVLDDALKQTGAYKFPDTVSTPYDMDSHLTSSETA